MIRRVVWCPSKGGHLRYTTNLVAALERLDRGQAQPIATGVLTTFPIGALYENTPYPIECVGTEIRERQQLPSHLHWAWDRISHHAVLHRDLLSWLRSHPDCHLVHLQEVHPVSGLFTLRGIRQLGRRIVYTMHNVQPHRRRNRFESALQRRWVRRILDLTDALIVHSESLRKECIALYGVDPLRVHVVPHGMSLPHCSPAAIQPPSAATNLPPVKLLCYGTLRRNKGFHHLLDALEKAPLHWQVRITGLPSEPDYIRNELEPRIVRLRAAGRTVDYRPGYVAEKDVADLFAWASLIALPYDGFNAQSGVLLDAIAHGVPVVASDSGALGETVRDLGIGAVTQSLSPDELLTAISTALALDRVRLAAAWQSASEQYSWGNAANLTAAIYRELD